MKVFLVWLLAYLAVSRADGREGSMAFGLYGLVVR
jgi:hypothetical protein